MGSSRRRYYEWRKITVTRGLSERLIFVSSLFYFRIPEADWQDRIDKVRGAGYDGVDVYIPWNFHEKTAGSFDFAGNADVGRFLDMVGASGLKVIARPGPYICSEWDGGGLPAWLYTRPDLQVRQMNPAFLEAVQSWFSTIAQIIRPRQADDGPIIGVQVENELDFYPCVEPQQYIEALTSMLRDEGIKVPITACLGNGDYLRATGGSEMVIPMVNIYPHGEPKEEYDQVLESYVKFAHRHHVDPMIMETSRDTTFLARLVSVGFRVISPYLMASGVNMDAWNGLNNWGDTPTFVTTDMDFGGMIAADGGLRESYFAQRVLTMTLRTLDNLISSSVAVHVSESGEPYRPVVTIPDDLSLHWRSLQSPHGTMHFAFNFGNDEVSGAVVVRGDPIAIRVPARSYEIVLDQWRPSGSYLTLSGVGSIVQTEQVEGGLYLVVAAHSNRSRIRVTMSEAGDDPATDQVLGTATIDHSGVAKRVALADGHHLVVVGLDRHTAGRAWSVGELGSLIGPSLLRDWSLNENRELSLRADWSASPGRLVSCAGAETLIDVPALDSGGEGISPVEVVWVSQQCFRWKLGDGALAASVPSTMEALGLMHGRAAYATVLSEDEVALRINGAADIVWAYANDQFVGSYSPFGESFVIPLFQRSRSATHLTLITEIWGHSNFEDSTRRSTRLGSQKGITGSVVSLPEGTAVSDWAMARADLEADNTKDLVEYPMLPMHCLAGTIYVLRGRLIVAPGRHLGLQMRVRATNARIDVRVNGISVGRLWFGPALSPRMVGGTADALWIRPDVLHGEEEHVVEVEIVTTADGRLDSIEWIWSPLQPKLANQPMTIRLGQKEDVRTW